MNGKKAYFGSKIQDRNKEKADDTLVKLYKKSEYQNENNNDVNDFLDNANDVDEEAVKEKSSAKRKRQKAEKKAKTVAKTKKTLRNVVIIVAIIAAIGGGIWFFFKSGRVESLIGDLMLTDTTPDEIYYAHLTGNEIKDASLVNGATTCVMIENSPEARPQSGLSDAGVIYEAIAEGGITRFMALFQENKPNYVGPVRSVRMTFAELAKPYHCSIAHVGGSDNALQLIRNNSAFRDIDQFFNSKYYWRISKRAAPHNVYTRFSMLDELNYSKGYRTSDYNGFARVKPDTIADVPETKANSIRIEMSSNLFTPVYTYDPTTNKYRRAHAQGGDHYSMAEDGTKVQNSPDVVIAMKVNAVGRAGTAYADYTTTGTGDAFIFQNGGVISARWERKDADAELKFVDTTGVEIPLNRGQVWISLYPSNGKVSYQ